MKKSFTIELDEDVVNQLQTFMDNCPRVGETIEEYIVWAVEHYLQEVV